MQYKYVTDNNLLNKQNYMYSEFGGKDFLDAYFQNRNDYINKHSIDSDIPRICDSTQNPTLTQLRDLAEKIKIQGIESRIVKDEVDSFTKSFEVRKRIYSAYDENFKPLPEADFTSYESYIVFASILMHVFEKTKCLKYLSCLLKIDDTVISLETLLDEEQNNKVVQIIKNEIRFICEVAKERAIEMGGRV